MRNPFNYRLTALCEDFAVHVYRATSVFPREELYGLTSQMRRSTISIGSNFVEGCGRQGDSAFLPFLHNALGSSNEVQFQLRVAARLEFGAPSDLVRLRLEAESIGKQLTSLITKIERS